MNRDTSPDASRGTSRGTSRDKSRGTSLVRRRRGRKNCDVPYIHLGSVHEGGPSLNNPRGYDGRSNPVCSNVSERDQSGGPGAPLR